MHLHDKTQEHWLKKVAGYHKEIKEVGKDVKELKKEVHDKLEQHDMRLSELNKDMEITKLLNKQRDKEINNLRSDYYDLVADIKIDYRDLNTKIDKNREDASNEMKEIIKKIDKGFDDIKKDETIRVQETTVKSRDKRDLILKILMFFVALSAVCISIVGIFWK